MNQTESVAESRWGVGLEKLTGGFVKKDWSGGSGGVCMCCAHGKCLNSVALVWLPDTSGGGRGHIKTEDLFIGTSILKSKETCFCVLV